MLCDKIMNETKAEDCSIEGLAVRWRRSSVYFAAFSLTVERSVLNVVGLQVLSFDNSTRDLRRTTDPVR